MALFFCSECFGQRAARGPDGGVGCPLRWLAMCLHAPRAALVEQGHVGEGVAKEFATPVATLGWPDGKTKLLHTTVELLQSNMAVQADQQDESKTAHGGEASPGSVDSTPDVLPPQAASTLQIAASSHALTRESSFSFMSSLVPPRLAQETQGKRLQIARQTQRRRNAPAVTLRSRTPDSHDSTHRKRPQRVDQIGWSSVAAWAVPARCVT